MQSLLSPAKQHISVNCYSQSFYYDQMLYNPAQIELSPRKWMIFIEAAAAGDFSDSVVRYDHRLIYFLTLYFYIITDSFAVAKNNTKRF